MNNIKKITILLSLLGLGVYLLFKEDESNLLEGGIGDNLSDDDVDKEELKKGLKVEKEHTKDKRIAKEIALDHLAEDPNYYSKLEIIHKENPSRAKKKNKKLWEKVKQEAV